MWIFAGPLLLILLGNIMSFSFALSVACRKQPQVRGSSQQRPGVKVTGSISLFLILGLTWISGFFFVSEVTKELAFVFTVLNSLQGAGIFVTTVLMNDKVRDELASLPLIKSCITAVSLLWKLNRNNTETR
nr:adhesion G protein-coupled receptor E5-like [Cherax quadricarinatus]